MNPPNRTSEKSKTQQIIDLHVKIGYAQDIDPAAIDRFIYRTFGEEVVDHEDTLQIASLLTALKEGTRAGDDMSVELQRILDIKKVRKTKFDPRTAKLATPECHVVTQYVLGIIRWVDAKKEFVEEFGYGDRTADRYIKELKPRIEKAIKANPDYYEKYRQNFK